MNTDKDKAMDRHPCSAVLIRAGLGAGAAAMLAATGASLAQPASVGQPEPSQDVSESAPRILIDRTMGQHPVRLVSISAESVEVTDPDGRVITLRRSQVLALVPPLTQLEQAVIEERVVGSQLPEKVRPLGRLDLVDGQSLPGTLASPAKPEQDRITWGSKLFGTVTLSLESVSTAIL